MVNKFISPIDDETMNFEDINSPKKGYFRSNNVIVRCPYDGEVVDSSDLQFRDRDNPNCKGGYFRIEHTIPDDDNQIKVYSNFCNLSGINPPTNSFIKQGQKIGHTKDDSLYYWITVGNSKKEQNILPFFKDGFGKGQPKKPEEGNKKEDDKEKKKDKEPTKKDKEPSISNYSSSERPANLGFDLATLPIAAADWLLGSSKKSIKEEVQRIKQLMK